MEDYGTTSGTGELSEVELYRGLFEHSLIEVHVWEVLRDDDGELVTWRLVNANKHALESWGVKKQEVVGLTTDEIFPGVDSTETFRPIVARVMDGGEPYEWELHFDGTGQFLHMVSYPVGNLFVSTGFDISKLRNSEEALSLALQSLHQAVQDGGVGLWEWDLRTNETDFSDEYQRQLGFEPGELKADFDAWRKRVHPDDLPATLETIEDCLESLDPYQAEFRMMGRDGAYRDILAHGSVLVDDDGTPMMMRGSHVDVTEKRRLEARVHESQKLEAVGTLAAGIAHDFNNILTALTGNVELLGEADSVSVDRAEIVADVKDALRRAKSLTSQLLTFAKGGSPVRETTDLKGFLVDSARFVARGTTVACVLDIDDDLPHVDADIAQLSQVLNNLLINAGQAMPDGGEVTLLATRTVLESDNEHGLDPGEFVEIAVADEGVGIDPEVRAKIFEPFFSTKEGGSGLGLSTSYAIVKAHGGGMGVENREPSGTVVRVFLPAVRGEVEASETPAIKHGSGRVLVLDDDASVARTFTRMLESLGYDCDAVASGESAVANYRDALESDEPYTAVILDLTIPGEGGGREVVVELHELDPGVVAIVASGYTDEDVMAEFRSYGFRGRLAKPVEIAELSATLRSAIDE